MDLVGKLFALGQVVGQGGNNTFQSRPNLGGYQNRAPQPDHSQGQEQQGAGGWGALAGVAGSMAPGIIQGLQSPTPKADMTLGAPAVSGDIAGATYGGSVSTQDPSQYMPKDNGTTPQTNPFALDYGNAPQRPGLLYNYKR